MEDLKRQSFCTYRYDCLQLIFCETWSIIHCNSILFQDVFTAGVDFVADEYFLNVKHLVLVSVCYCDIILFTAEIEQFERIYLVIPKRVLGGGYKRISARGQLYFVSPALEISIALHGKVQSETNLQ